MIRLLGTLFGMASNGALMGVALLAGLVHVYGGELPGHDDLVNYQPKMVSRVYNGEGQVIAEFYREKRIFSPIDEVPDLVKNAFISAEDKTFYTHPGVDAVGIVKAITRFVMAKAQGRSVKLSGASTITQQVMKNFLVGNERSFERKIKEAILAVRITGALSKDSVLELYLNDIFLGQNSYGVVAAAQRYFGKPLEELAPEEAAYLAALPKEPSNLHPVRDHDKAVARRNYVLEEMAQNGHLPRDEAEAAKLRPLDTILGKERPEVLANAGLSYFSEEVRRQLGAELGEDKLYEGGLTIRATVEPDLQSYGEDALRRALETYDRGRAVYRGPAGRLDSIAAGSPGDWRAGLSDLRLPRDIPGWHLAAVLSTGDTTALVGIEGLEGEGTARLKLANEKWIQAIRLGDEKKGTPKRPSDLWQPGDVIFVARDDDAADWTMRQIPEVEGGFMAMDPFSGRVLAMQGGFSFETSVFNRATQALRQPGSAFKPFVYAAALDAGYTPATVVLDAPVVVRQQGQDDWRPKNSSEKFYGPSPLRLGIEKSRNLMTVRIAQQIGMDRVAEYAERFGVYENMPYHLSYALGAGETSLYNMVAAYGMFANGGKRVRPTVVDRVQDRLGRTLFRHDPRLCEGCAEPDYAAAGMPKLFDQRPQIMDPVTAYQLVSMMQGVVARGTAAGTVGSKLEFPAAGKTGTTNEARDAWFIGFTPNMVAGCYIGYDNPTPMGRSAYGGALCGPVFAEFMQQAMQTRAPGEFRAPVGQGLLSIQIDRETGQRLPDGAEGANVVTELFREGTEPALYGTVTALAGDETLFGGLGSDMPLGLEGGGDLPFGEPTGDASHGAAAGGDTGDKPRPPKPPAGGGIGLGTGGLY